MLHSRRAILCLLDMLLGAPSTALDRLLARPRRRSSPVRSVRARLIS